MYVCIWFTCHLVITSSHAAVHRSGAVVSGRKTGGADEVSVSVPAAMAKVRAVSCDPTVVVLISLSLRCCRDLDVSLSVTTCRMCLAVAVSACAMVCVRRRLQVKEVVGVTEACKICIHR